MPDNFLGSLAAATCFMASMLTEPVEAGAAPDAIWNGYVNKRQREEWSGDGDDEVMEK